MTPRELEQAVSEIVRRMRDTFNPLTVYLYGSCATGTAGPESDIDVLVVVEESNQDFFERGATAIRALRGIRAPIDVQVYTRKEFEDRSALPVSFERSVRTQGRVLYAA